MAIDYTARGLASQALARQTYSSVQDFGAIGDGQSHPLSQFYATLADAQVVYPFATNLTDELDWASIQKCINTANISWDSVYIPSGVYLINKPLVTTSDTVICGEYDKSELRITRQIHGISIPNNTRRYLISDLRFSTTQATGASAFYFEGTSDNFHIRDVRILGTFDYGIYTSDNCWQGKFENVFIQNCKVGISLGDESNYNNFLKCEVLYSTSDAIVVRGGGRGRVFDSCHIELNTGNGIKTLSGGDIQIVNTYFERNGGYDIYGTYGTTGLKSILISGCQFYRNATGTYIRLSMLNGSSAVAIGNNFDSDGNGSNTYTPFLTEGYTRLISIGDNFLRVATPYASQTLTIMTSDGIISNVKPIVATTYNSASTYAMGINQMGSIFRMNCLNNAITLTLPSLVNAGGSVNEGRIVEIIKMDNSANNLTITASNGTILNSRVLTATDQYKVIKIIYNRVVSGTSNEWIMLN